MFKILKNFCSAPARVFQKNPNQELLDAIALNERMDPRYANELRAIMARHEEQAQTMLTRGAEVQDSRKRPK